jgi:hypothetical protein
MYLMVIMVRLHVLPHRQPLPKFSPTRPSKATGKCTYHCQSEHEYGICIMVLRHISAVLCELGSGQVRFVVDKVASGQVFSEYFGFPCHSFHQTLHPHNHPGQVQYASEWPTCPVDPIWTPPPTMQIKNTRIMTDGYV